MRTRTDGPSLNGALAGTGQLQLAFCVLLSAGLLALTLSRARGSTVTPVRLALRAPLRTAWGELRERELLQVRLAWSATATSGVGEAAPLEPLRRRAARRRRGGAGRLRRGAARRRRRAPATPSCSPPARPSATCPQALAAIDLALWDRAGRRAGRPVAHAARGGRGGARCRSTRRSAPRTARAPRRRRAAAARAGFGCVKVKVGHRRRRRPGRRGARGGRAGRWRSGSTPTAPGRRRTRRWPTCARSRPRGSSTRRSRCTASDALRAVRAAGVVRGGDGRDRGRAGRGGSGAADAVCLKIAPLRRDHRAAARRARARARPGATVYVASSFDGPLGIAAGVHAAAALAAGGPLPWCGLATLGAFDGLRRRRSLAGRAARSPCRRARACWDAGALTLDGRASMTLERRAPSAARPRRPRRAPRGAPRGRRRARRTRSRRGSASAIRSAIARNFSSRSPTTRSTRRSQLAEPVPQRRHHAGAEPAQRRGEARGGVAAPVVVRELGDAARHAGEQRLRAPTRARTPRSRSPRSGRRARRRPRARAARSAASAIPGLAPISTSRRTRSPSASAACSATRPPIE